MRRPRAIEDTAAAPSGSTREHREVVILIHGTGAGEPDPKQPKWWEATSEYATDLRARLGPDFTVGYTADSQPFRWSSGNSERERQHAGQQLLARLKQLDKDGIGYHLVGHSHGGSVIWNAIKLAGADKSQLRGLRSWTTIGTPFLEFSAIWIGALMVLACIVAGILAVVPTTQLPHGTVEQVWGELRRILRDPDSYTGLAAMLVPWTVLVGIFLASLYYAGNWLMEMLKRPWTRWREQAAAKRFKAQWLSVWHTDDEPLGGLSASMLTPIRFMPRMTGQRNGWLWRILFLPVNRVVAPVVNHIVAPVVDEFVWVLSMGRLQGNDMIARVMVHAGPAPRTLAPGWPPLPEAATTAMTTSAGARAAVTVEKLRHELASLGEKRDGDRAVQQLASAISWTEILHTCYFDHAPVRELVAAHIVRHSGVRPAESAQIGATTAAVLALSPENAAWFATPPTIPARRTSMFIPWRLGTASLLTQSAVAAGLTFAAMFAYSKLVEPMTRDWQVAQLAKKATSREFMTGNGVREAADLGVRLEALGRNGTGWARLITDDDTKVYVAQRIAYAQARSGKLRQALAEATDHWTQRQKDLGAPAAVLAHALAGYATQHANGRTAQGVDALLAASTDALPKLAQAKIGDESKLAVWSVAIPPLTALDPALAERLVGLAAETATQVAARPLPAACAEVRKLAAKLQASQPPALSTAAASCSVFLAAQAAQQPPRPVPAQAPPAPPVATLSSVSAQAAPQIALPKPVATNQPPTAQAPPPPTPESVRLRQLMKSSDTYKQAADLIRQQLPTVAEQLPHKPDAYKRLAVLPEELVADARQLLVVDRELAGQILTLFVGPQLPEVIAVNDVTVRSAFKTAELVAALGKALNRTDEVREAASRLAERAKQPARTVGGNGGMLAGAAATIYHALGDERLAGQQILSALKVGTSRRYDTWLNMADLARQFDVVLTRKALDAAHGRVYDDTAQVSADVDINRAIQRLRDIGKRYLALDDINHAQRSLEFAADLAPRPKNAPYGAVLREYTSILDNVILRHHKAEVARTGLDDVRNWPALIDVYTKPPG